MDTKWIALAGLLLIGVALFGCVQGGGQPPAATAPPQATLVATPVPTQQSTPTPAPTLAGTPTPTPTSSGTQTVSATPFPDSILRDLKVKTEAEVNALFPGTLQGTFALQPANDLNYAGLYYQAEVSKRNSQGLTEVYKIVVRRPSAQERLSQGALYSGSRTVDGRVISNEVSAAGTPAQTSKGAVTCFDGNYYVIFEIQRQMAFDDLARAFFTICPATSS